MDERFIATSREELASLFGRSPATVHQWAARGLPGEKGRYDLREVLRWREQDWEERLRDASKDPMLAGESSPWQEEYRKEKTLLARMDRFEREGQLVKVDDVRDGLLRAMALVRNAGEQLQKDFGPEAHAILDDAIDDAIRMVSETMGGEESDRAGDYDDAA